MVNLENSLINNLCLSVRKLEETSYVLILEYDSYTFTLTPDGALKSVDI